MSDDELIIYEGFDSPLFHYKVVELKKFLRSRGLKVGGRKAQLVDRLKENLVIQKTPIKSRSPSKSQIAIETDEETDEENENENKNENEHKNENKTEPEIETNDEETQIPIESKNNEIQTPQKTVQPPTHPSTNDKIEEKVSADVPIDKPTPNTSIIIEHKIVHETIKDFKSPSLDNQTCTQTDFEIEDKIETKDEKRIKQQKLIAIRCKLLRDKLLRQQNTHSTTDNSTLPSITKNIEKPETMRIVSNVNDHKRRVFSSSMHSPIANQPPPLKKQKIDKNNDQSIAITEKILKTFPETSSPKTPISKTISSKNTPSKKLETEISETFPETFPEKPSDLTPVSPQLAEDDPIIKYKPKTTDNALYALFINGFRRPLRTEKVTKELEKYGKIDSFWMNEIKTHCYIIYNNKQSCMQCMQALNDTYFPTNIPTIHAGQLSVKSVTVLVASQKICNGEGSFKIMSEKLKFMNIGGGDQSFQSMIDNTPNRYYSYYDSYHMYNKHLYENSFDENYEKHMLAVTTVDVSTKMSGPLIIDDKPMVIENESTLRYIFNQSKDKNKLCITTKKNDEKRIVKNIGNQRMCDLFFGTKCSPILFWKRCSKKVMDENLVCLENEIKNRKIEILEEFEKNEKLRILREQEQYRSRSRNRSRHWSERRSTSTKVLLEKRNKTGLFHTRNTGKNNNEYLYHRQRNRRGFVERQGNYYRREDRARVRYNVNEQMRNRRRYEIDDRRRQNNYFRGRKKWEQGRMRGNRRMLQSGRRNYQSRFDVGGGGRGRGGWRGRRHDTDDRSSSGSQSRSLSRSRSGSRSWSRSRSSSSSSGSGSGRSYGRRSRESSRNGKKDESLEKKNEESVGSGSVNKSPKETVIGDGAFVHPERLAQIPN